MRGKFNSIFTSLLIRAGREERARGVRVAEEAGEREGADAAEGAGPEGEVREGPEVRGSGDEGRHLGGGF